MKKPAPHTRQYFLVRWKPHQRYTLEKIAPTGAECIPVMGAKPARELQKELNASLPRKRNGWKPGERPAGSGRKKLEDPTSPVTLRIAQSVLDMYPGDVYERNREMVEAIANAKKSGNLRQPMYHEGVEKANPDSEYWKARCLAAEEYISETPCDPDITEAQAAAYRKWQESGSVVLPF